MIIKIFIALITFATITACDTNWNYTSKDACTTYVNNLMEQSQNFDASDIAQWLPGAWSEYSIIIYDENWETIEQVLKYNGVTSMIKATNKITLIVGEKSKELEQFIEENKRP